MKKYLVLFLILLSPLVTASEQTIISKSNENREGQEHFFLRGTQQGSYTVKSWQFDKEKAGWDKKSEPHLTIGQAIQKAYIYLDKDTSAVGVKSVEFAPAFSREGSVIWFYLVTLTTLPYKFGSEEYETVVLLSGEILTPYGKQK